MRQQEDVSTSRVNTRQPKLTEAPLWLGRSTRRLTTIGLGHFDTQPLNVSSGVGWVSRAGYLFGGSQVAWRGSERAAIAYDGGERWERTGRSAARGRKNREAPRVSTAALGKVDVSLWGFCVARLWMLRLI
jgi:hypothetical protein